MRRRNWIALIITIVVCSLLICGCILTRIEWEPVETEAQKEQIAALTAKIAEMEQSVAALTARIRVLEEQLEALTNGELPDELPTVAEHEDDYAFIVSEDGYAVITSYLGSSETVEIPARLEGKQVVAIGEGAFRNGTCKSVVIPEGVRRVDWFAFSGCHRLESVALPATVVEIGYGAFERCAATLKFVCPQDSYAAEYANSYGIAVNQ